MNNPSYSILEQYQIQQLSFEERLQSLQLQLNSLPFSNQDAALLSSLLTLYASWKNYRVGGLLSKQCRTAINSEKTHDIHRLEMRILEQRHCIARKEEEIWEQSWNGKRIRYLGLHQEHMLQFHHEIEHTKALVAALAQKDQIQRQIFNLKCQLKQKPTDSPQLNVKRIDSAFFNQMMEEDLREKQLRTLAVNLQNELTQLSRTHRSLVQRYQQWSNNKREEKGSEEGSSAKSLSTSGEEPEEEK